MKYEVREKDIILTGVSCFDPELCLFCGQAFRWQKRDDSVICGIVGKSVTEIVRNGDEIIFRNTDEESFRNVWIPYFDLERDYEKICEEISRDKYIKQAVKEYYGIRILRQDSWEALCSFIISQNNNIPRISGIISRLCESFGERVGEYYTFPSYEKMKDLTVEDLAPLRAGFRAKYIIDAVQKLVSGEISLEKIEKMPIEQARQELMKIKGVGAKVAECTLLYGFGRVEAFPVDVWVRRIMAEMYEEGLPSCTEGNEGIAQQYLFHWRRNRE